MLGLLADGPLAKQEVRAKAMQELRKEAARKEKQEVDEMRMRLHQR